jgi:predicted transposase YdaD
LTIGFWICVRTCTIISIATIPKNKTLKTDSIFFKIFKTDPGILFELLGRSPTLAQGYEFRSVEIKQVAFRLDGVLLPKPDSNDQTVWFVEVQFQHVPEFYNRFFGQDVPVSTTSS